MQYSTWSPTRPTSTGATAYHDAVVNTSWHKKNINGLIKIAKEKIKSNDIIVDFGAGTGASAIYVLKHLEDGVKLFLVDNSPSWLGKAHEILHENKSVAFFLLGKKENRYMTLDEVIGKNTADHIISVNTVHLIPTIDETFNGIYGALKKGGTFIFQSGNIAHTKKEDGILMIDDSIDSIHDRGIEIIRTDKRFAPYKKGLDKRIAEEDSQRKFIFPTPRPIEFYLQVLKSVGFENITMTRKRIKVRYEDWLNFLKVRRLQAGILPEVGGKDASEQEEKDRDAIITKAALQLFKTLKKQNPLANATSFTAEWTYVYAEK